MLFFHYVVRKLVRRFGNNALTVVVIAAVLAGCMLGVTFLMGLRAAARESIAPNHVLVTTQGAIAEYQSQVDSETVAQLAVLPGLQTVNGRPAMSSEVTAQVTLARTDTRSGYAEVIGIRGMDADAYGLHDIKLVSGRLPSDGAAELVVGTQLARRYPAIKVGSKIALPTESWEVVGVFSADGSIYEGEAIGPKSRMLAALRQDNVNSVLLVVSSAAEAEALSRSINDNKRLAAFHAQPEREFRGSQAKLAQVTRVIVLLVFTLCLIGVFVTATNLHASLMTRMPELAALIATGVRRTRVAGIILMESLVLSLIGAVLATVIMLVLQGRSSEMFESSAVFDIELGLIPIAFGVGLAVIVALVGGVLPAYTVRRIDLVDALR